MAVKATVRRREQSVNELLRQSVAQLTVSPRTALELATAADRQARETGDAADRGKSLHAIGLALTFLGDYDAALARLQESREIFQADDEMNELARVLNSIGNIHQRMGDVVMALRIYREGAALLAQTGEAQDIAGKIMCNIALIYRGFGDHGEASRILLDLLPIYEESSDPQAMIILDSLGAIYAELGDHKQSHTYHARALERARSNGSLYGQAMTLGNLGAICNDSGRMQEALEYLTEALAISEQIADRDGIARTLHNIGISHDLLGQHALALRYMRRSAREALAIGNARSQGYTLGAVGGILRRTGKPQEAIRSLEKALKTARKTGEATLEYNIHEELSRAYEDNGDITTALRHHRLYAELRERIRNEQTHRMIAELQARFDLDRAEQQKELYRLRSEQLEQDLRVKNGELTAMALRLVQRSEMLDLVKDGIVEVLRAQNGSAHPTLRSVLHTVEGQASIESEWRAFEQQFQRVHPDYIRTLSMHYPQLSPTELKICALLKTSLNSKEIAGLLHVSLRDIENHRYRIRKKLGLAPGENLVSFLAAM